MKKTTEIKSSSDSPIFSAIYDDETGMLHSILRGRISATSFRYDGYGRLEQLTSPTGVVTSLRTSATPVRHEVTMETSSVSRGLTQQEGADTRDVVIVTEPGYLCDVITTTEGELGLRLKEVFRRNYF